MSLNSVHIQNKVNKSGFLILDQYQQYKTILLSNIDFGGSTKNTSCTRQFYGMEGHLKPWEVPIVSCYQLFQITKYKTKVMLRLSISM